MISSPTKAWFLAGFLFWRDGNGTALNRCDMSCITNLHTWILLFCFLGATIHPTLIHSQMNRNNPAVKPQMNSSTTGKGSQRCGFDPWKGYLLADLAPFCCGECILLNHTKMLQGADISILLKMVSLESLSCIFRLACSHSIVQTTRKWVKMFFPALEHLVSLVTFTLW